MVETDTHTLKCYGALKQIPFSTPLRVEKVPEGGMRSLCLPIGQILNPETASSRHQPLSPGH